MAVSDPWNRRQFLNAATVVSSSALSALSWPLSHAEPTPETTTIRIVDTEITCIALLNAGKRYRDQYEHEGWAYLFGEGLVSEDKALGWKDEVWGKLQDEDEE